MAMEIISLAQLKLVKGKQTIFITSR